MIVICPTCKTEHATKNPDRLYRQLHALPTSNVTDEWTVIPHEQRFLITNDSQWPLAEVYDRETARQIIRDHRLAALVPGLMDALRGLTQRTLSSGPCFCVVQYEGAEPLSLSYFENAGAKTGHDNGFRHNEECLAAREVLNAVAKEREKEG